MGNGGRGTSFNGTTKTLDLKRIIINSNRKKRRNGKSRRKLRLRSHTRSCRGCRGAEAAQRGAWLLPPPARRCRPTYRRRAPDEQHQQQQPRAGPHRPGGARPPGRGGALGRPVPCSSRAARGQRQQPRTLSHLAAASRCPLWAAGEAPAARRRQQTPPPRPAARGHAPP